MKAGRQNYTKQLMKLDENISDMGSILINSLSQLKAVILTGDKRLAGEIIETDAEVRALARKVEDRCIRLIMREQPVATDLRVISSSLKLVTDLERMHKQAVEISEIALEDPPGTRNINKTLAEMSEVTYQITVLAVDAYLNKDLELIQKVVETDDKIDAYYEQMKAEIVEEIKREASFAEESVDLLLQAKYLEKIGDHAENIVNWVNYSITGDQLKE